MNELETYDALKAKATAFVAVRQSQLRLSEADRITLVYDLLGLLLETRDGGRDEQKAIYAELYGKEQS